MVDLALPAVKRASVLYILAGCVFFFALHNARVAFVTKVTTLPVPPDETKNGNEAQLDRHKVLKAACEATKSLRVNDTLEYLSEHPQMLSKMIYDDKHKLIYCYIAKVSSTQWKNMFAILSGRVPKNLTKSQMKSMKLNAHDGSIHHFLSQLPAPEIRHRLETYTSFLFVRHPVERLVSGMRNKFRSALMRFPWQIKHALDMIAHSQGREPWQVGEEGPPDRVTFEQFARWVADAPPPDLSQPYQEGPNDEHWRPMSELCHPCTVPYTVLGRYETMREDARYLLELANITSISLPKRSRDSETSAIAGPLMATLTPETRRRVLRHFLQDFVLFGYRPDTVFQDFNEVRDNTVTDFENVFSGH